MTEVIHISVDAEGLATLLFDRSDSAQVAVISTGALGAKAAKAEAKPKITSPVSRMRWLPIRSARVPIGTRRPAISSG